MIHRFGVIALVATLWATHLAYRSVSWDTACYEANVCDSLTFTAVSELLADGQTPYLEQVRREHISRTRLNGTPPAFDLPFQYPPNALPLFALRSAASPRVTHAATVFLTTLVSLVLVAGLIRKRLGDDSRAPLLMLSISLSPVVWFNAVLGQTGLLAAALVIATALCWQRTPLAAGVLLGVLTFKPQYAAAILIVATVRRDWIVVTAAGGTLVALTLISGIWFGFDQWAAFVSSIREANHTVPWMVNWMGVASRLAPDLQEPVQTAALPVFAIACAVLGALLWRLRSGASLDAQLGLVTSWAVVISPNTHPYDLLVLCPALVYVSRRWGSARTGAVFLLLACCTLPSAFRWLMGVGLISFAGCFTSLLRREADSDGLQQWRVLADTR